MCFPFLHLVISLGYADIKLLSVGSLKPSRPDVLERPLSAATWCKVRLPTRKLAAAASFSAASWLRIFAAGAAAFHGDTERSF